MRRLRVFHRWHAVAMSLIVLGSAGSGLVHTWMSRTQPPPPPARPAGTIDLRSVTVPPSALPSPAAGVVLRSIDGRPWWQVMPAGEGRPRWFDAGDGHEDVTADERYAAQVAADFLRHPVRKTAYLTAFDREYIAIFRLLPVYRFDADDGKGTRVYVSTVTGSVSRHTDDRRQWEADLFSTAHKWNFIPNRAIRDWALIVAMGSLMVLAGTGLFLFWKTRLGRDLR